MDTAPGPRIRHGRDECEYRLADISGDGVVSFDDINPFVALLTQ